nr:glycosyltransferase 87 family protein [Actinoplanes sp. M2I2]
MVEDDTAGSVEESEDTIENPEPAASDHAGAPTGMVVVVSEKPITAEDADPITTARITPKSAKGSAPDVPTAPPGGDRDEPPAESAAPLAENATVPTTPAQADPEEGGPRTGIGRFFTRVDQAAGGYAVDLTLYALSAAFALITALNSTLLPHRAWGTIAVWSYSAAFLVAGLQFAGYLITRRRATGAGRSRSVAALFGNGGRAAVTWTVWGAAALLPLVVQAVQRAGGRTDRAQEEVLVVEHMGERLLNEGTPYLSRDAIAALPADERLTGYSPYQPGMSIFGLPRALFGDGWWTDSRVWFALFTAAILIAAVVLLHPRFSRRPSVARSFATVRALQAVTVLPICALTLATGGDDIPVLAFCLLALTLAATDRYGWAGVAIGAAAACKLIALPVVAVLAVLALAVGRGGRFLPGAIGLPILVLVAPFQVDQDGFLENVIRFPLGHGLVTSPAQSPFPGYLLSQNVPNGRYVALGLLLAVALVITVRILWWRPRSADTASLICGWGLLAAILLMPTTRFGYLLYPIAFLVWAGALRPPLGKIGSDSASEPLGTQQSHSSKSPAG